MRLEELYLDHFGPFSGERLDDLSPRLNVIHGPNEAGKSALRAFVRAVLFGFLPRNAKDFAFYHYPAQDGSAAGGTASVVTDAGGRYTIRRREGRGGGPVEVWGDRQGGDELLNEILGRVAPELYQNLFSISLSELQDFASLNQAGVRDRIYSAGLGLSGVALPDALKQLESERSNGSSSLWAPRSGQLREALRLLAEKERDLEGARDRQGQYAELGRDLAELQRRAEHARRELTQVREEERLGNKLLELRPHWLRAKDLRRRIEQLPDPAGLPVDGIAELDRLQQDAVRLQEQIREGDEAADRREREVALLVIVPAFIDGRGEVEQLLSEVQHYRKAVDDLPGVEAQLNEQAASLEAELGALGPGWDEEQLRKPIDLDVLRSSFREVGTRLGEAVAARSAAELDLNAKRERRAETEVAAADSRARLEALGQAPAESVDELEDRSVRLERLRREFARKGSLERELRDEESRLADLRSRNGLGLTRLRVRQVAMGAVVVGAAFVVAGVVVDQTLAAVAGGAFLVAGLAAALLASTGRQHEAPAEADDDPVMVLEHHVTSLREEVAQVSAQVEELRAVLSAPSPQTEDAALEQLEHVGRDVSRRREFDTRNQHFEVAQTAFKRASEEEQRSAEVFSQANAVLVQARESWRGLLEQARLDEQLQAADALAALERVHGARQQQAVLDGLRTRVRDMQLTIADIERRLSTVLRSAGMGGFESGMAVPALRQLQEAYSAHVSAVEQRRALTASNFEWTERRELLAGRVASDRAQITALFERTRVETEDDFRRQAELVAKRRELQAEFDGLRRNHPELFGEDRARYIEPLEKSSEEHLTTSRDELALEIAEAEAEQATLQTQIGGVQRERQRLEEENPVSALQTEISQIREEASELAKRWAVLTLAKHFIEKTRDDFQKHRQAPLLKTASDHFRSFTLGRYDSVTNPIGEARIVVSDAQFNGELKDPAALSRGTAEQLFLAMRFAWIDEYTRERESLPVVMDDVLVNFDPERASAVCERIVNLSQRHQVLVLTCHPETVTRLRQAASDAGASRPTVIDLASRG